jgi:hypothetical protein
MITGQVYFYLKNHYEVKNENGFSENHYIVIKVNVFNNNIDEAERKVRTIAGGHDKLAGGYFTDKAIPCDFNENYTVIHCPDYVKIQEYDEADNFIMALIESER